MQRRHGVGSLKLAGHLGTSRSQLENRRLLYAFISHLRTSLSIS